MNSLRQMTGSFFDMSERCVKDGGINKADLLCLKNSLENFLKSGKKSDAFNVFFCYSEIFRLFGKGYENTQKLLELLSDHEYHSGELLDKHRDHYSHSVYVFALGLVIYANDGVFRKTFNSFYGIDSENGVNDFLRCWGLIALFHDIGYPFQLAHEQIKIYSESVWGDGVRPYVSFGNMSKFLKIDDGASKRICAGLNINKSFESINELLAYWLEKRTGYAAEYICKLLKERVVAQPAFMDHGYFSAVILAKKLFENAEFFIDETGMDVLTAILLHNNLNKYDIKNAHAIKRGEHPLAYLLILCDELQNWDRYAYGKSSKSNPIAWDALFAVSENYISVEYLFDSYSVEEYKSGKLIKRPNTSYEKIQNGKFVQSIYTFIDTDLKIDAVASEKKKKKRTKLYVSEDNFINLCDFAKAIHASYDKHCLENSIEHINSDFASLPLEFKIANIEQAKSYAYKLELINCFYSSKSLDYPEVTDFNSIAIGDSDNIGFLCREEHARWVKEKLSMGWSYGEGYKNFEERNKKKIHKDIVPYEMLSEEERSKDELMVRNIIPLLRQFDNNIRIYNYRAGRKPDLVIAGTGHRHFKDDREKLKSDVKAILQSYAKDYRVIVRTCYAAGADWLIAECACELGLTTKAAIPMPLEDYIKDIVRDGEANGHPVSAEDILKMRHLLAQTVVCKVIPDPVYTYYEASKYIITKCDKVIALWDGNKLKLNDDEEKPVNRGGTWHCIKLAERNGKQVHIVDCYR